MSIVMTPELALSIWGKNRQPRPDAFAGIRFGVVSPARADVQAGTYLTDARETAACERLADAIGHPALAPAIDAALTAGNAEADDADELTEHDSNGKA